MFMTRVTLVGFVLFCFFLDEKTLVIYIYFNEKILVITLLLAQKGLIKKKRVDEVFPMII